MKQCNLCDWWHELNGYQALGYCGYKGKFASPDAICKHYIITPLDYPEDDHIVNDILIEDWHIAKGLWALVPENGGL